MKNRKFKMLIASVAMVGSMLATACGKFTLGPADTDGIDVTLDTKGTKITLWTGFGSEMTGYLNELIDDFTAKTGIIVEHESKGGYPNLLKAINLSATKGSFPNVANGYPDHFASYIKSNILLRLDGLIQNDSKRGEVSGAYKQNGTQFGKDKIMLLNYEDFDSDYTFENETLEYKEDGTGYKLGLPFNKSTEVLVYNSTFFDWAEANETIVKGLTGGVEIHVPETWADVKETGLAVIKMLKPAFKVGETDGKILGSDGQFYISTDAATKAGATVIMNMTGVLEDEFRPMTYDATANMFITLVRQYGGQYTEIDKEETGKGYAVFNNPQTVQAMTMLKDLFDEKVMGIPAVWNELYCSTPFKAFKSIMNVSSTGGLSNIVSNAFSVKCTHIPYASEDKKFVISQGTSLGLFNKGTDKEKLAAWKLMVYLSQQGNGQWAASSGYFPTCNYSYNSNEYVNYLDSDFKSNADILRLASAKVNKEQYTSWEKFVDPGFRGSADIREQVDLIPGYLLTGEHGTTVEEILEYVESTVVDYLKD